MSDQKDILLTFKSTKKGSDSKGADRLQLYMSKEELDVLIGTLKEVYTERGAVLDIHTGFRESKKGTKFLSSYAFARGVQEPQDSSNFAPKTNPIEDKIAALKNL